MSMKVKAFKIHQIPIEENKKANVLANLASGFDFISDRNIPLEFLPNLSIDIVQTVVKQQQIRHGWTTSLHILKMGGFH